MNSGWARKWSGKANRTSVAPRCYGKASNAKVRTSIQAAVNDNALVYDDSKCVVKTKKKGLSGNKTKHIARTRSVRPPLPSLQACGCKETRRSLRWRHLV